MRSPAALVNGFVVTSVTTSRADGEATTLRTYEYDTAADTVVQTVSDPAGGEVFSRLLGRYDERGRVVREDLDFGGAVTSSVLFEYEGDLITVGRDRQPDGDDERVQRHPEL